jgi:hypothetical protein
MSWEPAYTARFIETALRNFRRIAERDHEAVVEYYNSAPDGTAAGVTLEKFAMFANSRFSELFIAGRFDKFPVLIVSPEETDSDFQDGGYFDGAYSVLCEVWAAGSDSSLLKSKLARYDTAVRMMFATAVLHTPGDFVQGVETLETSGVALSLGKTKYFPVLSAGPNFYRDRIQIPFKLSYMEA